MRLVGQSEAAAEVDLVLDQNTITVGSAPSNSIVLDDPAVGAQHLLVRRRGAEWMLEPLDPTRPVYLNGIRIIGKHAVRPGDVFEVGPGAFALVALPGSDTGRRHDPQANRKAWLGASVGLLLALVAFVIAFGAGPSAGWSFSGAGPLPATIAPDATSMSTAAPPTPAPAPTAVALRSPTAVLTPLATASATTEPSRATLEAALGSAPHLQVVAAMTVVAALDEEERERALERLGTTRPDDWLHELLSTPTPLPPRGRLALGRWLPEAGRYDVVLRDLASSLETQLVPNASQPAFSSDRRFLAYRSWQDDALGLFVASADGTERWLLTQDAHEEDMWPAWAPDGSALAFASARLGDGLTRVYVTSSQGGPATTVTYGGYVDWSPDGSRLAVQSCLGGDCGIMLVPPDGSELERLTTDASDGAPAWSPNGQYIAFHSHREGKWSLYVMRSDGSGLLQLTDADADDCVPVWSPDGHYLAFRSDRGGEWAVWAVPASGGEPTWMFDAPVRPGEELVERISWLP